MKKKESFGVTLMGVIFVVAGIYFINTPLAYLKLYFPKNPLYAYTHQIISNQIATLDEERKNITDQKTLKDFEKKSEALRKELNFYQQEYLDKHYIPFAGLLIIIWGAFSSILFILCGIAILRLFPKIKPLLYLTLLGGLIMFPLFFWDAYVNLDKLTSLSGKLIELTVMVNPELKISKDSLKPLELLFKNHQGKVFFTLLSGYLLFSLVNIFFFNRSKIKTQFIVRQDVG